MENYDRIFSPFREKLKIKASEIELKILIKKLILQSFSSLNRFCSKEIHKFVSKR